MKIYFSGAISAGRDNLPIYQHIVQRLKLQGHNVLSSHVADPQALDQEKDALPRYIFERDVAWVDECEAMIAEVSTPSTGVGYEYGHAIHLGKPVLCVYRSGVRMTKMVTGNPASNLQVAAYSSEDELNLIVDAFLKSVTG